MSENMAFIGGGLITSAMWAILTLDLHDPAQMFVASAFLFGSLCVVAYEMGKDATDEDDEDDEGGGGGSGGGSVKRVSPGAGVSYK